MRALFVDSGRWLASVDGSDPNHTRACAARDSALEAGRTLITSDYVIDETLTLIRVRLGIRAADAWWHQIDRGTRLRWERVDSGRFEKARGLFFQYQDKDFSFTDCTSVAIMRELRLTHALTHRPALPSGGLPSRPRPRSVSANLSSPKNS